MSTDATDDCPLGTREQTRNLIIFAVNKSLIYFASPVLYVGNLQAALCKELGTTSTVANLPSSVYFWMTPLPILVAWYFCAVRLLRPVLTTTYLTVAAGGAAVMATLLLSQDRWVVITAVVLHSAMLGCALGVAATYEWEVLGKGVSRSRRGQTLALAFGVGPMMAFLASLGSQAILNGIRYPWNFAALFASTVPLMALAALLATRFVVPQPAVEVQPEPLVAGVFGGVGDFFRVRLLLLAAIAMILVASGYNVLTNMSLFTKEALGEQPARYVGYQNALRFGFKVVAGLLLGWLLARTHPKAGMLVTGGFCLASVAWVSLVPGRWFLLSFGLMGAGELFGVYYPNYILSCSPKEKMRRNMAFTSMLNMPSGFAPLLFGFIADTVGAAADNKKLGFQMSFLVAAAFLSAALLVVQLMLPARPQPQDPDVS
jgi:hypothetical protein